MNYLYTNDLTTKISISDIKLVIEHIESGEYDGYSTSMLINEDSKLECNKQDKIYYDLIKKKLEIRNKVIKELNDHIKDKISINILSPSCTVEDDFLNTKLKIQKENK